MISSKFEVRGSAMVKSGDNSIVTTHVPVPYPKDRIVTKHIPATVPNCCAVVPPCSVQACPFPVSRIAICSENAIPGMHNNVQCQSMQVGKRRCISQCLALKDCIRQCPMTSAGPNPCSRPAQECNARCPMSQMSGSSFELSPFVQSPRPKMHVQKPNKRGEFYEPFPTLVGHCNGVDEKIPKGTSTLGSCLFGG